MTKNTLNSILLVIPEYNDNDRLKPFLKSLARKLTPNYDVLIVDDGSTKKNEVSKIKALVKQTRLQGSIPSILPPIIYHPNRGKGAAIRAGFSSRKSKHKYIGFVDADGCVNADEILRLSNILMSNSNIDVAIGSRRGDKTKKVEKSLTRMVTSAIFSHIINIMTNLNIKDTQCGLKLFKATAYQNIEPYLETNGFATDIELCTFFKKCGANITEVPINWSEIKGSKINLLKDSVRILVESWAIAKRAKLRT